jgi:glutamate/tyrosine decarboxylase-like PLP-dependent enzyme
MGWDVQSRGLFGAPDLPVVVGDAAHSTVSKALGMVGLGRDRVIRVPVDAHGRLRADALPDLAGPAIVCVQAGEVNTGAFDPFVDVVEWARERGGWVHVDGAFGLWALASPGLAKRLCAGLEGADSWATDAHKWLNVTYDSGIAFVRRGEDLRRSFASVAGYLPPDRGYEAMHHTPQSSQRARQIEIWAVLRSLGRSGVADLVDRCCSHARSIAGGLTAAGLEVANDVVLNQVLVRAPSDELTSRWIKAIQEDGTCWCGPTTWQGRPAMRVSVSGWSTTEDDIKGSLDAMVRCARDVGAV